jgi:hypothetical protein
VRAVVTKLRLVVSAAGLVMFLISGSDASAAVYGGETSQNAPIAITLTKSGHVKSIAVAWTSRCTSGHTYNFGRVLIAVKKRPSVIPEGSNPLLATVKKGKLSGTAFGTVTLVNQMSGFITHRFSGRLKGKSASGTWRGHADVADAEGNKVDSCDSGTLHWIAARGPTAYGGSTTQGEPVVVVTSKDRSKIEYFGFGWQANCAPSGFWHIAEEFGNFPMTRSGVFGDTFTNDFPFADQTGKNSFTYRIHGSAKKSVASGSFSVHVVASDTAGATTATCDTNSVKWSARQ